MLRRSARIVTAPNVHRRLLTSLGGGPKAGAQPNKIKIFDTRTVVVSFCDADDVRDGGVSGAIHAQVASENGRPRHTFVDGVGKGRVVVGDEQLEPVIDNMRQIFHEERSALAAQMAEMRNEMASKLGQIGSELDQMRSKLDQTRSELGTTRSELGKTRSELGQTRSELGQTRSELGQTRSELGQTRSELDNTKNNLANLSRELSVIHSYTTANLGPVHRFEAIKELQQRVLVPPELLPRQAAKKKTLERLLHPDAALASAVFPSLKHASARLLLSSAAEVVRATPALQRNRAAYPHPAHVLCFLLCACRRATLDSDGLDVTCLRLFLGMLGPVRIDELLGDIAANDNLPDSTPEQKDEMTMFFKLHCAVAP